MQSYAFDLDPFKRTYFLYIHPLPLQISSLTISRLFSFLLVSEEVKFHYTNIKKISMVSIYSLRPVYTFLYTNNKWQCNSFLCTEKEKFWDFVAQKKSLPFPFVRTYYVDDPNLERQVMKQTSFDKFVQSNAFCTKKKWVFSNFI